MVAPPGTETDLRALVARELRNPAALGALALAILRRVTAAAGGPTTHEFGAAVTHLRDAITLGNRAPSVLKAFGDALNSRETIPGDWDVSDALIATLQTGLVDFRPAVPTLLPGPSHGGVSILDALRLARTNTFS